MVSDERNPTDYEKQVRRCGLVDEGGTTFAEFGLVFVLIAVIVFMLAVVIGGGALNFFQHVRPIG
jgi:Flp pilus assembly pilin Flp